MRPLNASGPALLLALAIVSGVAAEPPMEKQILLGPESVAQWAVAESTLEASSVRTRSQQPVLHWHIAVDYFTGEPKYPVGWPRISCPLREAAAQNWAGWDFLQFWVYTDTTRNALPSEPAGLALYTPDKEGAYNRPLTELGKGQWVPIRIPLTQVPRHQEVRLIQFHISEANYRHQDQLDFYFDELTLLRYAHPTLLDLTAEQTVMFADTQQVPVRFNLAGVKPGESVEVACELRQAGKMLAQAKATATRGPQRLVFDLHRARLRPGEYELVAHAAGGMDTSTARVRLVASPWK
ncbi:MAG TPA: hypothetical protein VNZ22_03150 [Bacillota bacterium]|nr:hypothetical protein [Bacillota bacterium]